jgi:DNA topoisomerase-1
MWPLRGNFGRKRLRNFTSFRFFLFCVAMAGQRIFLARAFVKINPIIRLSVLRSAQFFSTRVNSVKAKTNDLIEPNNTNFPYRLVIVESPAKCQTLDKILNNYCEENSLAFRYKVTSCYGHIRNLLDTKLPKPDRFPYSIPGIDLNQNYKPLYQIIESKKTIVKDMQSLAAGAERILLATDPDREGEAMAWHLKEVLNHNHPLHRVSFSEITPSAVLDAITLTHDDTYVTEINPQLVQAQETRRVLDRLAGYTLSPILWRKISPGLSAGRVQSVAMALSVHRERERLLFEPTEYWDVQAQIKACKKTLNVKLFSINGTSVATTGADFTSQGRQLKKSSSHKCHLLKVSAQELVQMLSDESTIWRVKSIEMKPHKLQPPQPYRTSTLQQDANRRCNLSIQQSMQVAQQLYEAGYISYMRTDSSTLSEQAERTVKSTVVGLIGAKGYVSNKDRNGGKTKHKNAKFAQEAHEAIRPAVQAGDVFAKPDELTGLSEAAKQLYRLIHQRTLASRMQPLIQNRTRVVIEGVNGNGLSTEFRTRGSVVVSPGFTAVYSTLEDENEADDEDNQDLPALKVGQVVELKQLDPLRHETLPPSRYNEASFVKELEALGVGRPSTFAGIVQILRERAYVGSPVKDNNVQRKRKERTGSALAAQRAAGGEDFTGGAARGPLVPSLSAFAVCGLLEKHCPNFVNAEFTAKMEERLDRIASGEESGEEQRVQYLDEFYAGENGLAATILRIEESSDTDEARRIILPHLDNSSTAEMGLFVGPWGPYVQLLANDANGTKVSVSLPSGLASDLSLINSNALRSLLSAKESGGLVLGQHPDDGRNIRLKTGRFGAYLQWGDDDEEGTTSHSLPKSMRSFEGKVDDQDFDSESSLDQMMGLFLEQAVGYCGLPRTVCIVQDSPVTAAIGPYGPYLKFNNKYVTLTKKHDVLTIDAETAEQLVIDGILNVPTKRQRGVVAEIGEKDGSMVTIKLGRFGSYINWKKVNAKLPKEYANNPSDLPLDEAWSLLQQSGSKSSKSKGKKTSSKSTGKSKSTRRKASKSSDTTAPELKRPKSSYLYFTAANRGVVSETVSSFADVSKKLSELWAATSKEDRKPFENLAAMERLEYNARKAALSTEHGARSSKSAD